MAGTAGSFKACDFYKLPYKDEEEKYEYGGGCILMNCCVVFKFRFIKKENDSLVKCITTVMASRDKCEKFNVHGFYLNFETGKYEKKQMVEFHHDNSKKTLKLEAEFYLFSLSHLASGDGILKVTAKLNRGQTYTEILEEIDKSDVAEDKKANYSWEPTAQQIQNEIHATMHPREILKRRLEEQEAADSFLICETLEEEIREQLIEEHTRKIMQIDRLKKLIKRHETDDKLIHVSYTKMQQFQKKQKTKKINTKNQHNDAQIPEFVETDNNNNNNNNNQAENNSPARKTVHWDRYAYVKEYETNQM